MTSRWSNGTVAPRSPSGWCANREGCVATLADGGWPPEEIMKETIRPAIFKWRQTEPEVILCAVRWYLRYSLSFSDVEELLSERGMEADHTTI